VSRWHVFTFHVPLIIHRFAFIVIRSLNARRFS